MCLLARGLPEGAEEGARAAQVRLALPDRQGKSRPDSAGFHAGWEAEPGPSRPQAVRGRANGRYIPATITRRSPSSTSRYHGHSGKMSMSDADSGFSTMYR